MKQNLPKLRSMKNLISVLAIASVMVACNTNPNVNTTQQKAIPTTVDTTGYAQFQSWKAQNELTNTTSNNAAATTPTKTHTKTVVKYYPVKESMNSTSSGTAYRKKSWSSAAKGAVIGGVGGAAAGAIINRKNRAVGGIVGGILGAGVGYGIGRHADKKNGRY